MNGVGNSTRSLNTLNLSNKSQDNLTSMPQSRSAECSEKSEYEDEYVIPMNIVDMTHGE